MYHKYTCQSKTYTRASCLFSCLFSFWDFRMNPPSRPVFFFFSPSTLLSFRPPYRDVLVRRRTNASLLEYVQVSKYPIYLSIYLGVLSLMPSWGAPGQPTASERRGRLIGRPKKRKKKSIKKKAHAGSAVNTGGT